MLKITFERSKSLNYYKALMAMREFKNHSEAFGFEPNTITLDRSEIFANIDKLYRLVVLISKWSGTRLEFEGKSYHPYRFILEQMNIKECAVTHNCQSDWGCTQIKSMLKNIRGNHRYIGQKYWYNYGKFIGENTWQVDKAAIKEIIKTECLNKNLTSCPHFSQERINEQVSGLPDKINTSTQHWEKFFRKEVDKDGRIIKVPINIRHIANSIFSTENKALVIELDIPYQLRKGNYNIKLS